MTIAATVLNTAHVYNKRDTYEYSCLELPGSIQLLHCRNSFFECGVLTLFDSVFRMYVIQFLKQHAISFLPVYIFSGESVTEVCNIIKKKPIDNYAIVFGDEAVYRLLCNIYSIERVCFISSNSSIITVKRSIQRFLKIKERQSFHEVTMTKLESLVLSFLVEGKTPYQASREFELSVQSISRHKRNAMLKLGVRTTTELFLKYALLIAQREE